MFKNPFSFNGRIRRTEFGISYLIYLVCSLILNFYVANNAPDIVYVVTWLPLLWFLLAQSTKRCHDRGNSGWFQLIPFYVLFMLFGNSDYGPNEYGKNPKGEGNHDAIDKIGVHTETE